MDSIRVAWISTEKRFFFESRLLSQRSCYSVAERFLSPKMPRLIIHRPTCAHILLKVFFAVSDEIQSLGTIMKFT